MKIAFFILNLIRFLPRPALLMLANFLGWLAYYLVIPRRKVGQINLRFCFPEFPEKQRKKILKKHFQHMALLILEYGTYWYASAEEIRQLVDYQDKEYLDKYLAQKRSVILLYPHFTAFELAVYALNQDVPLTSVYSHQKNPVLDQQILQGRHRYQNVFLVGRTEGLRSIVRRLRDYPDAPLLYLPDQDFGAQNSVFVDFFNIPTATTTGLARLARLTDAVVIPVIPQRLADGRVNLRFYPAWTDFPSGNDYADAEKMNAFIEARIREMPEQYFWLHKRFKTRPNQEPSFYQ
ncbi:lipid A biosynthesis lauroyl acyltransferase [Conchiformibius steedae DSM 2580]|uniref:Lipid A biosynthesis lauroyl acyltransferase n=1 Tax=Conchiformibius steedae DSM 2580 TaxID=1121352 RepID=A0AAE9KZR4_9NEIS|nr:lipid A biosynthesis lauroyl acyltransferase [Conchiformibius steedae]QMT32944.1 lipid A biosynthesis lauroyl acyltransferase [Conchiformibius steedae]URD67566.1 lipid A biosynthesis lauroyl acyltransferase [Conchiformibius steedae DSM 2580]